MRKQLRPFYTDAELASVYDHPYDHTRWADHIQRVTRTIEVGTRLVDTFDVKVLADLSAGDGAIIDGITKMRPGRFVYTGDFVPRFPIQGKIEHTIKFFTDQQVDLFICSETLEHVEDPDALLREIRRTSKTLLLTTPCWIRTDADDDNPEHYWQWDRDDLSAMIVDAGFKDQWVEIMPTFWYTYQIWICR
jgi:SAM-dependent methyltransferase